MLYFGFQYPLLASIDAAMGKWLVTMLGFYSDTAAAWFDFFFYLRKILELTLKGAASK